MSNLIQSGYEVKKTLAKDGYFTINEKIGRLLLKDKPLRTKLDCFLRYQDKIYDATIQSKVYYEGSEKEKKYYHFYCPELKKKIDIGDKVDISVNVNKRTIIFSQSVQPKETLHSHKDLMKKKAFIRSPKKLSKNQREQDFFEKEYGNYDSEKIIQELSKVTEIDTEKFEFKGKRYKRINTSIALLKILHDFQCQICNKKIEKRDGSYYVEGAHIIPKKDGGSETPDNILILCPNCHKEFDYGKLKIKSLTKDNISFKLNGRKHSISLKLDKQKSSLKK